MRADILTRSFLICTEALAIACLAILQCYAAPQDSTVPVRFAGRDQVLANWLPMIAQEEKYWEPEGVQVEYQTVVRGRDASQALVSGQSDITAMSEFSFMLALHHYDDLRLFGSIASSSNSVILIGDTSLGVHKITDIVGKRVALSVGSGSQFYVEDLLLQMGVKRDSIEILNLEPQALVSGAKRHEVPVMATWQPFSQQIETALGTNSVILREPSNIRPYQMSFVLVAREDFLRRNSAKLERFLPV
jgi:ABC-type nitrate/sulfonate/bicarbonate transport system substrate-binding protein